MQAAVTGLEPKTAYVLALAANASGSGRLEPLAAFTTNPAGSAIVNTTGPIRKEDLPTAVQGGRTRVAAASVNGASMAEL